MAASVVELPAQSSALEDAFPNIDFGVKPLGSRVLVQIRLPKEMTAGGIILSNYSKEAEQDNTQVAKVIAVGPLAFKNRETMTPWPEGAWAKQGDYVFVPKYAGSRWYRKAPNRKDAKVEFVIFNDLDMVGLVEGDPLDVQAYI